MKTYFITLVILGILGISSCNTKPDLALEEQNIRQLYKNLIKFSTEKNWEGYSGLMTQDPKLQIIHPENGEWLMGREAFEQAYEPLIRSGVNADFLKNDLKLYFSRTGDMAWGTIDVLARFNDYDSLMVHSWNVAIFEKEKEGWKVVFFNQSVPKNLPE